jgi:hypothetical protein
VACPEQGCEGRGQRLKPNTENARKGGEIWPTCDFNARLIADTHFARDTAIPKSTISETLAGKKPFSRQMIRKLAVYSHVEASVLAANF